MNRLMIRVLLLALLGASPAALAGPFADDMAKCLVNSTTRDRAAEVIAAPGCARGCERRASQALRFSSKRTTG